MPARMNDKLGPVGRPGGLRVLDSRLCCRVAFNFADQYKARLALATLRDGKTVQEMPETHQVNPNQVGTWKRQAVEGSRARKAR